MRHPAPSRGRAEAPAPIPVQVAAPACAALPRRVGAAPMPCAVYGARCLEVGLALTLLILTLPLLLLVALAVLLDSPGPLMRGSTRRTGTGEPFRLFCFRTDHDGRVSRVGRVIRPCRVDQLPVLLNLLVGDMALFGPPPLSDSATGPGKGEGLLERPGLSGWLGEAET